MIKIFSRQIKFYITMSSILYFPLLNNPEKMKVYMHDPVKANTVFIVVLDY